MQHPAWLSCLRDITTHANDCLLYFFMLTLPFSRKGGWFPGNGDTLTQNQTAKKTLVNHRSF